MREFCGILLILAMVLTIALCIVTIVAFVTIVLCGLPVPPFFVPIWLTFSLGIGMFWIGTMVGGGT